MACDSLASVGCATCLRRFAVESRRRSGLFRISAGLARPLRARRTLARGPTPPSGARGQHVRALPGDRPGDVRVRVCSGAGSAAGPAWPGVFTAVCLVNESSCQRLSIGPRLYISPRKLPSLTAVSSRAAGFETERDRDEKLTLTHSSEARWSPRHRPVRPPRGDLLIGPGPNRVPDKEAAEGVSWGWGKGWRGEETTGNPGPLTPTSFFLLAGLQDRQLTS